MKAFAAERIFDGYDFLRGRAIIAEGAVIRDIVPAGAAPPEAELIDLGEVTLAPGFIDLQINGCGGVLFNDDISAAAIGKMCRTSRRFGTTSIMPTLITSDEADFRKAVEAAIEFYAANPTAIMGVHLEGPFISRAKRGAHNAKYIRPIDAETVDFLCDKVREIPIVLTAAPEENDHKLLRRLALGGVRLSLGHTNATYEEAMAGIADGGMRLATHLFNAMSAFESRSPGAVGAVLNSSLYTGLIVDGRHSSFHSVNLVKKIKGDRIYIVTDAVTPMGTDMTEFPFAGQMVKVVDGKCVNDEGALAGSNIDMLSSVKNAVLSAGIEEGEALRMATLFPASAMGMELRVGALRSGMAANMVAYTRDFKLAKTYFQGEEAQIS